MLFLFPVNTDAPVNYFPSGTIGLIITNVVVFILTGLNQRPDLADPWILWFGAIQPYQWLTGFFVHAGFIHLIANMVFLWVFGLVVEGKLGWKKFVPLYLILGISQGAVEQFVMSGADAEGQRQLQLELLQIEDEDIEAEDDAPRQQLDFRTNRLRGVMKILKTRPVRFGAMGASAAIYGLLAISMVWSPKNTIQVVGLLGLRFVSFEVTIVVFATLFIVVDLLIAAFYGFGSSTTLLHMMGAATGATVGVAMFKLGKVDCEDWDIFSVMSGNYGPHVRDIYGYRNEQGKKTKYSHPEEDHEASKPKKRTRLQKVNDLIAEGDYITAYEEFFSVRINKPDACLDEEHFKDLGMGLVADEYFDEAEAVLEDYIDAYPDSANWAYLRLAAIQLQQNGQPRASYKTVRRVNKSTLTDKERDMAKKIAKAAKKQIDDGVVDRESEW